LPFSSIPANALEDDCLNIIGFCSLAIICSNTGNKLSSYKVNISSSVLRKKQHNTSHTFDFILKYWLLCKQNIKHFINFSCSFSTKSSTSSINNPNACSDA